MPVTGMQRPDFRTISEFRKRHLAALTPLFTQVPAVPGGRAEAPPPDAEPGPSSGMSDHGWPRRALDSSPPAQAQRNFTDPDSRLPETRGYNGQLAVDSTHQIIIVQRLTSNGSNQDGLAPLLDPTTAALGRKPCEVSADAGFCREVNLAVLVARRIRGYLAPGALPRAAPTRPDAAGSSAARAWPRWRPSSSAARL
jgi:hypothetical protein